MASEEVISLIDRINGKFSISISPQSLVWGSEIRNRSYKKHLSDAAHSRRTIDKLRETMIWMEIHSYDFLVEMKPGMITKFHQLILLTRISYLISSSDKARRRLSWGVNTYHWIANHTKAFSPTNIWSCSKFKKSVIILHIHNFYVSYFQ